jgi:hypothetical protein
MSNYQEKPIRPEVQADIEEWIAYGRSTFGISDPSSPAETIKTVGDFIDSWQVKRQNGNVVDDPETVTDTGEPDRLAADRIPIRVLVVTQ